MSGPILLILRFFMTSALYAFLGLVLWILWRDMKRQSEILSFRQVPSIKLLSVTNDKSKSFQFSTTDISIGREPASDCHLIDDTVSANHARLSFHHGNWWINDLGSKNGTMLNQETVSEPQVLASGDQLRCGQVALMITINSKDR